MKRQSLRTVRVYDGKSEQISTGLFHQWVTVGKDGTTELHGVVEDENSGEIFLLHYKSFYFNDL